MDPARRRWRQSRNNVDAARRLRKRLTPAEELLWQALRGRRNDGLKFRRQHPVGPFVLDFCCPTRRLAIEMDGAVHREQLAEDRERSRLLAGAGYRLLRFSNEQIGADLGMVLDLIGRTAAAMPYVAPAPGRWGTDCGIVGPAEKLGEYVERAEDRSTGCEA